MSLRLLRMEETLRASTKVGRKLRVESVYGVLPG